MAHAASEFQKIARHNNLFQEQVHDAYKAEAKLAGPARCAHCGAVYHEGRWQWLTAPDQVHEVTCPACHRMADHYPAGILIIKGDFFQTHRDEVMSLLHHCEQRERAEHPLKRIMAVEEVAAGAQVSTTDLHLARGMGEALHHAYQGKLEFHYSLDQNLLRVSWAH